MELSISNDALSLAVDTCGAQMMSLRASDGVEYLWQGDPHYWVDRAPLLFPFIGRMTGGHYTLEGKAYPMPMHGFAKSCEFAVTLHEKARLSLELHSTPETTVWYPFSFSLEVTYTLRQNTLEIRYRVCNRDQKTMFFAIGAHPGFNCPLLPGERFDEYELVFSRRCAPDRVGFTPAVYLSGQDTPYPLQDGHTIPLRHDLFDDDAIILKHASRQVTLRSRQTGRGVCVSYPDMPYVGFWHVNKTQAPFICIEPWSSLPDRQDVTEEWSCRSDYLRLPPGKAYETGYGITVR